MSGIMAGEAGQSFCRPMDALWTRAFTSLLDDYLTIAWRKFYPPPKLFALLPVFDELSRGA
jgi:hypothetical protein